MNTFQDEWEHFEKTAIAHYSEEKKRVAKSIFYAGAFSLMELNAKLLEQHGLGKAFYMTEIIVTEIRDYLEAQP